jgi:hypothetical protein
MVIATMANVSIDLDVTFKMPRRRASRPESRPAMTVPASYSGVLVRLALAVNAIAAFAGPLHSIAAACILAPDPRRSSEIAVCRS